ncbi:MAG: hypothetical protein WCF77_02725, partial [Minisyncoccia bacterium]
LFFFLHDSPSPASSAPSAVPVKPAVSVQPVSPAEQVQPTGSGLPFNSPFANFPPPSKFRTFTYDATGVNSGTPLTVTAKCNDTYVTMLIFPATVDYREGMDRAVYNEATPCSAGKTWSAVIGLDDLGHAPYGTYYFFTADQGTTGTWYNPI